jgi:hypothetical protein
MAGDKSETDTDDASREQGIEFGHLYQALEDHDYPTTRDELVAEYGDHELDTGGGSESFATVLKQLGDETGGDETGDDQTYQFESAEEVRQAVFNLIGSEAVGRQEYSDRGDTTHDTVDEDGKPGDESL